MIFLDEEGFLRWRPSEPSGPAFVDPEYQDWAPEKSRSTVGAAFFGGYYTWYS